MHWIFIAFLEPIFYGLANVFDSNLTNRIFKNAWSLTVFVAVSNVILIPVIWLIGRPNLISLGLVPCVFVVAFLELYYGYPYYKALQSDDTSTAISLFSLGKIFVPLLAFFILHESLHFIQYFGFFIIIASSVALTYDPKANFKINKSFFYMMLSSSLLSLEVVLYKYLFNHESWSTGFFWVSVFSAAIGLSSFFIPKLKNNIKSELPALKKYYPLILLVGITGFLGSIGLSYTISQVPATVSRSIDSSQPFFVLLYAILFRKYFPSAFKERIDFQNMVKKIALFFVMALGIFLTIG